MKLYKIAKWNEVYENNRSRTVKDLTWVPIQNKHDGEHYSMLIGHENGAKIFSAFILMVEVASRCQPRGSLVRDNGKPHNADSLAVKTRAPKEWFKLAFEYLEHETDWLEVESLADERQDADRTLTPSRQRGDEEGKGREGREQKEVAAPPAAATGEHQAFIQGWSENFLAVHKVKYQFDGGKDGKAVRELLKMGIQRIDILEIAKKAWAWKGNVFLSGKSLTIHGFRQHFNEINSGVTNGTNPRRNHSAAYSGTVDDNPRNAGTCKPVTDYAAAALKRQQQQRDRQAESEAALAGEMASNETPPPPATGNG